MGGDLLIEQKILGVGGVGGRIKTSADQNVF